MQSKDRIYAPHEEIVPGYWLVDPLGQGAFGEVWRVRATGGLDFALKIIQGLDESIGRKEFRGLQAVKGIRHPNLCPIVAFWLRDADGNILDESIGDVVEMESSIGSGTVEAFRETANETSADTVDGPAVRGTMVPRPMSDKSGPKAAELVIAMGLGDETLFDRLEHYVEEGEQGIPVDELLGYFDDSAKAIDFLNRVHQIQHCDIKPQNILLVGNAPQVCDFGMAKSRRMKNTTDPIGSPAYAAPELMPARAGQAVREFATTDQYSLAISYVELRTGRLPYREETPEEVRRAKSTGELDLSKLPAGEAAVIRKATSLDPKARYGSCEEMVKALGNAVHPTVSAQSVSRLMIRLGIGLVTVILMLAAVGFLLRNEIGRLFTSVDKDWKEAIDEAEFVRANQLLEDFPPTKIAEKKDELRKAWLAHARLEAKEDSSEGLRTCSQAIGTLVDAPEILKFRNELVEQQLADVRQQLQGEVIPFQTTILANRLATVYKEAGFARVRPDASTQQVLSHFHLVQAMVQSRITSDDADNKLAEYLGQVREQDLDSSWRPHWLVLNVAQPTSASLNAELLSALVELAPLAESLGSWEQRQVRRQLNALQQEVESVDADSLAPFTSQIDSLWPGLLAAKDALQRARGLRENQQWEEAKQILVESLNSSESTDGEALRIRIHTEVARIEIEQPRLPLDVRARAFTQLVQHANQAGFEIAHEAAKLVNRLEMDATMIPISLDDVEELSALLQAVVGEASSAEQVKHRWQRVLTLIALGDESSDPADIRQQCLALQSIGQASPLTQLADVEAQLRLAQVSGSSLISLSRRDKDSLAELARELMKAPDQQLGTRFAGYPEWVAAQALAASAVGQADSSGELASLFSRSRQLSSQSPNSIVRASFRLDRAALVLNELGSEIAKLNDSYLPVEIDREAMQQATRWLSEAKAWDALGGRPASPDLQISLLVGALFSLPPEFSEPGPVTDNRAWKQIAESSRAITTTMSAESELAAVVAQRDLAGVIHLASGLSQMVLAESNQADGLKDLTEAARLIFLRDSRSPDVSDAFVYRWIVEPATQLIRSRPPQSEEDLRCAAEVLGIRGQLLWHSIDLGAALDSSRDPLLAQREALGCFQEAEQLLVRCSRPVPVDNYVSQARLVLTIPNDNVAAQRAAVEQLADKAMRIDAAHPGALGLQAHSQVLASRVEGQATERLRELTDAADLFGQAIALSRNRPEELVLFHEGRSAAHLEAAFYSDTPDSKRPRLKDAVIDAQTALNTLTDLQRSNPANAYICLGNALEDHAIYLDETEQFPAAIAAFERAKKVALFGSMQSYTRFNLGRCKLRYAKYAQLSDRDWETQMIGAENNLTQAVEMTRMITEKAEPLFWLGHTHSLRAKRLQSRNQRDAALESLQQADQFLRRACTIARLYRLPQWPSFQSQWAAVANQSATLARMTNSPEAIWMAQLREAKSRAMAVLDEIPARTPASILPGCGGLPAALVLPSVVQPAELFEVAQILSTVESSLGERIRILGEILQHVGTQNDLNIACLLRLRLARMVIDGATSEEWLQWNEQARRAAQEVQQLASQFENLPLRQAFTGHAAGTLGLWEARVASDSLSSGDVAQDHYQRASSLLTQSCGKLGDDLTAHSLDYRRELIKVNYQLIGSFDRADPSDVRLARDLYDALSVVDSALWASPRERSSVNQVVTDLRRFLQL